MHVTNATLDPALTEIDEHLSSILSLLSAPPLISAFGIFVFLLIGVLFSSDRKSINFRVILPAIGLQAAIAGFILYVPAGQAFLLAASGFVQTTIGYSQAGMDFMFGPIGSPQTMGFIFAFHVLPIIVFFSSLIAVLYYLGIIQYLIKWVGLTIQRLLGTSQAESFAATANIMIGGPEVLLMMRPYIRRMTDSELFAVMVGGTTSVSGAALVAYSSMGVDIQYLLAAVFMSAPGSLLIAKIMMPETQTPEAVEINMEYSEERPVNVIDAAASGASTGANVALAIGAILVAITSLIALLNGLLGGIGGWFGMEGLTLEGMLGIILSPITFLLGVPWAEASTTGSLLGQKVTLNEFIAFSSLADIQEGLSDHSRIVMTFALCGFANLATPPSLLSVFAVVVREKRSFVAKTAMRVVLAGTLANLVSAGLASIFISLIP